MNDDDLLPTELARLCGVSADTIRHYERVGVIPPAARGGNGYRRYRRETVDRVRLVRRALAIGFSLDEIARIVRQRDAGTPPCRSVRTLAGEKLAELDRQIAAMLALRDELAQVVDDWDARLSVTRDGEPARLLESIAVIDGVVQEGETPHETHHRIRTHPRPRRAPARR